MYVPECSRSTMQLQSAPVAPPKHQKPQQQCDHQVLKMSDMPFSSLNLKLGRWDNSISYKYFDNFQLGDKFPELSEQYIVCLATQSSLDKLNSLVEVSYHWTGPISAAIYAAGDDELSLVLLYIMYLRLCFATIREQVNFHLALPKDRMPKSIKIPYSSNLADMDCSKPDFTLQQLLRERTSTTSKWRVKNVYPQNHMRNLARKNCQSGYVFLTDVDIIPSLRLNEELDKFLRITTCQKNCAYVIPTYELDKRVKFPPNKTELVRLANKGLARPFHQKVFIYNQYATNFSR